MLQELLEDGLDWKKKTTLPKFLWQNPFREFELSQLKSNMGNLLGFRYPKKTLGGLVEVGQA